MSGGMAAWAACGGKGVPATGPLFPVTATLPVNASSPHYLLFSESRSQTGSLAEARRGRWRFVLEALDGSERFEASDEEPEEFGQRLELLAVVRGLEALDQPSRVTLVTASSYVSRGIRHGLAQWRENDWMWERFGKMTPVKDRDLWKRIDHALRFHQVECRTWRYDDREAAEPAPAETPPPTAPAAHVRPTGALRQRVRRFLGATERLAHGARAFLAPRQLVSPQ